jgi:hypothetical protein
LARRRKSSIGIRKHRKLGTEELNRQKYSGMAGQGQLDAPRFGFSSSKLGKLDVCVFYAKFAAKKFLDIMIEDDEIEWLDDNTLLTSEDVRIRGLQLKQIYNHKVTYNEDRYHSLGDECSQRARVIRSDDEPKPYIPGEDSSTRRRTSRKGMTLMKDIAAGLNMTPRMARGILRGKVDKPKHGWAWRTADEVQRIKNILQGETRHITVDLSKCEES